MGLRIIHRYDQWSRKPALFLVTSVCLFFVYRVKSWCHAWAEQRWNWCVISLWRLRNAWRNSKIGTIYSLLTMHDGLKRMLGVLVNFQMNLWKQQWVEITTFRYAAAFSSGSSKEGDCEDRHFLTRYPVGEDTVNGWFNASVMLIVCLFHDLWSIRCSFDIFLSIFAYSIIFWPVDIFFSFNNIY